MHILKYSGLHINLYNINKKFNIKQKTSRIYVVIYCSLLLRRIASNDSCASALAKCSKWSEQRKRSCVFQTWISNSVKNILFLQLIYLFQDLFHLLDCSFTSCNINKRACAPSAVYCGVHSSRAELVAIFGAKLFILNIL